MRQIRLASMRVDVSHVELKQDSAVLFIGYGLIEMVFYVNTSHRDEVFIEIGTGKDDVYVTLSRAHVDYRLSTAPTPMSRLNSAIRFVLADGNGWMRIHPPYGDPVRYELKNKP